ncbi:hypothetical protein [Desulfosporosinus fructosivorans]|uniref:hypothetical protein n=1 Tax=Desulfosporosinus fructosivorans TaxID=2018669 RepID=UPI0018EE6CCD|nr:hypothetical protein [Desulfosporosinus fructosivorans]
MSEENKKQAEELKDGDMERVSGGYTDPLSGKGHYAKNPPIQSTFYCSCGAARSAGKGPNWFHDNYSNNKKDCPYFESVGESYLIRICGNCYYLTHY